MSIITDRYGKRAPENAERQSPEPLSFYGSPVPETGSSGTAPDNGIPVEKHPWQPFIPDGAKVLMLGSFPPKKERWSMDFFYPNFNNDMWRIIGIVFFGDKDRFIAKCGVPGSGDVAQPVKRFDKDGIIRFCSERGLALYDTAYEVRRMKDNASDRFLEIVAPVDIERQRLGQVSGDCRSCRHQETAARHAGMQGRCDDRGKGWRDSSGAVGLSDTEARMPYRCGTSIRWTEVVSP